MISKRRILAAAHKSGFFAPFRWANRQKLLILTYHRFSRGKVIDKVSSDEFASHLEYLKKHTTVISLTEATEILASRAKLPRNATVITIDDGYCDAFDVAFPVLRSFSFPATLFAVVDFLDGKCWLWTDLTRFMFLKTERPSLNVRFESGERIAANLGGHNQRLELAESVNTVLKRLPSEQKAAQIKHIADFLEVETPAVPPLEYAPVTWPQAVEMEAGGLQIESHTLTHPILTSVDQTGLDLELRHSKERLEQLLNKKVKHFCYPNGNFDESVRRSVQDAGYQSAVTTDYGFNNGHADRFALKRIGGSSAIENFAQSVSGFELARITAGRTK